MTEEEPRGIKRAVDEWEEFAKKLKRDAEERVVQQERTGAGNDAENDTVMNEIGAVGFVESDYKYNEVIEKFIGELCEETFEVYDGISGELRDNELITKARGVETETFKKHGVYDKVPLEECWRVTGRGPVGVKWVDTNKGDKERPEYRCR